LFSRDLEQTITLCDVEAMAQFAGRIRTLTAGPVEQLKMLRLQVDVLMPEQWSRYVHFFSFASLISFTSLISCGPK
jgi:hypothetical protein